MKVIAQTIIAYAVAKVIVKDANQSKRKQQLEANILQRDKNIENMIDSNNIVVFYG